MRNDKITVKNVLLPDGKLMTKFFLDYEKGSHVFVCERRYSKSVYAFFKDGVSMKEVYHFSQYRKRNEKLNKVIDRLPSLVKYAKLAYEADLAYEVEANRTQRDRCRAEEELSGFEVAA